MTIALFVLGWLACGVVGAFLTFEFGFRRHRYTPVDIKLTDIVVAFVLLLTGPLSMLIGAFVLAIWVIAGFATDDGIIFRKVSR